MWDLSLCINQALSKPGWGIPVDSEEMMKGLNRSGAKVQFTANYHFSRSWNYPHHSAVLSVYTAVPWSLPVNQTAHVEKELGCVPGVSYPEPFPPGAVPAVWGTVRFYWVCLPTALSLCFQSSVCVSVLEQSAPLSTLRALSVNQLSFACIQEQGHAGEGWWGQMRRCPWGFQRCCCLPQCSWDEYEW